MGFLLAPKATEFCSLASGYWDGLTVYRDVGMISFLLKIVKSVWVFCYLYHLAYTQANTPVFRDVAQFMMLVFSLLFVVLLIKSHVLPC